MTVKIELSKGDIELINYWYDYLLAGSLNPKSDPYLDVLNKIKSAAKMAEVENNIQKDLKGKSDYILSWSKNEDNVCICSHTANKHAGNGVCVSDSCNCFDFKLKE
ncbi:MAG: hypothetical protein KGO96_07360 [Elusimicrobia bacterium]|nr:hypothetical protein [Elusimicrobiota bacterium]